MKQEIVHKPIADLIPYANNARTHSDEQIAQIAASIKEFGFTNPILLDGTNGIIAGHGRLMAARKLSLDTVPCIELSHLSDKQKKAYILADNRLAMNSGWDENMLRFELSDIGESGFNLDLIGFDIEYLSKLFDESKGIKIDDVINTEIIDKLIVKFKPDDRIEVINAVSNALKRIEGASVWADE